MKKTYRVWDDCNDFETVVITTEEEIQRFARFLKEIFGDSFIQYEELRDINSNTLYKTYADYLKNDGFSDCKEEISKLRGVDSFLRVYNKGE